VGATGAAIVILLAAAAISACGSSGSSGTVGTRIPGDMRLAKCSDWRLANREQRLGTLAQLENFAGGPVGSAGTPTGEPVRGRVLGTKQAYDLFQRYCSHRYALQFLLWRLYTRAAAFVGH
jgi:hypothetical protein